MAVVSRQPVRRWFMRGSVPPHTQILRRALRWSTAKSKRVSHPTASVGTVLSSGRRSGRVRISSVFVFAVHRLLVSPCLSTVPYAD